MRSLVASVAEGWRGFDASERLVLFMGFGVIVAGAVHLDVVAFAAFSAIGLHLIAAACLSRNLWRPRWEARRTVAEDPSDVEAALDAAEAALDDLERLHRQDSCLISDETDAKRRIADAIAEVRANIATGTVGA